MSETEGPAPRRTSARERVLDAIRAREQLSRVEIAAMTGLTEASISTTVRRLIADGLLVETGRTPTGGKPRTMLRLDPGARFAVGVHVDATTTTLVLTGQTGGVISRTARPARESAAELSADVAVLLEASGADRRRCLGVGLVWAERSTPVPPDLVADLARDTGWPVLVENDATAAAVGEYWVARVDARRSFIALYMGAGIGSGIVLDGRPLRGRGPGAGEFGHVCLQVDGPECWCGARGCLEVLAGPRTVVERARAHAATRREAGLTLRAVGPAAQEFAAIARAARTGAPGCRALLRDSARLVAAAAESAVNLLDVDLVVLTGPSFAVAASLYGPAITERLSAADARTWHRDVTVTVSSAAATASATGAAALVLQQHNLGD
ncbi:ROK family transcriptional regulator [Paenibacillus sp. TRM 82003]|uniref:ROK family transcriptional regulator n=1 Tax=Kineococcus sp. TRM81007 TaxID=2925831 RepID=UPI001F564F8C|nr:ROK family transcriptional regulator [Kineococcus sp. TRM81007]MCI2237034.1 ROK family transcriptional regulator [Kineococcus sp. TRM81007]MCI3926499.1 ROK family transcriptional regulator [Paenibacillus sp. TRM 82003]